MGSRGEANKILSLHSTQNSSFVVLIKLAHDSKRETGIKLGWSDFTNKNIRQPVKVKVNKHLGTDWHYKIFIVYLKYHFNWASNALSCNPRLNWYQSQFSCSVESDSWRPHVLQHTRLPCPSSTTGACSNSCPLSQWCDPTISSSVVPFFSCLQSFPASGSFLMGPRSLHTRWSKYWSFSISPSNKHSGLISFRIDWFYLLAVQRTLKSLLQHHSWKASTVQCSVFFMIQLSYPSMTTGGTIALTRCTFVSRVMYVLFNIQTRFVIAFLPRSKHLLIS